MKKLTLVEISNKAHKNLKIKNTAVLNHIAKQHLMNLRANELGQAATCYPIFATKNSHNEFWTFSAMTGFAAQENLFVKNDRLDAIYRPTSIQTYPFYLMSSPVDKNAYSVGIIEDQGDFSQTSGEAIFDEKGEPTEATKRRVQVLEADVLKDAQTAQFSKTIEELGLLKPIDMTVSQIDGDSKRIKGLHTIDEDRIKNLTSEELDSLYKNGYLLPIHAIMISILQVNKLISLNNEDPARTRIIEVKMQALEGAADS
ncbi:MAG: hypothetical protein ACI97K_000238 [Glaciecola sp.]|jgi:hypothetical protein